MNQDIEKSFVCETYLENVFEIPVLQQEIRKAWSEALQKRPRRKKAKAELGMDIMLKIFSALGRLVKVEDELHYVRGQFEQLNGKLERARAAYREEGVTQQKRLVVVARELEFSSGKVKPRRNSSALFWDYISLITCGQMVPTESILNGETIELKPTSKNKAIDILTKKYGHDNGAATAQALKRETARRKARGAYIPKGFLPHYTKRD